MADVVDADQQRVLFAARFCAIEAERISHLHGATARQLRHLQGRRAASHDSTLSANPTGVGPEAACW